MIAFEVKLMMVESIKTDFLGLVVKSIISLNKSLVTDSLSLAGFTKNL